MRLMGKRQIGELEPFELVIALIIADLATIPMAELTIPIWYGVIPLLMICVLHFAMSFISKKFPVMRNIISGKPVVVVDDNGIDFKELKKLNISCEELMEALRNLDYFDMSDINYAIIERNGKITVIPKSAQMPATREDIKVKVAETDMFYCVIENGKVIKSNVGELELKDDIVAKILEKMNCKVKDIAFASATAGGDVYAQRFTGKAKSLSLKVTEATT